YHILTVTYRHTPLKEVGRFVLADGEGCPLQQRLHELRQNLGAEELLYLATCNRVMFLLHQASEISPEELLRRLASAYPTLPASQLKKHFRHYAARAAIEHLFRVAASIDSMVVGEREILRQLREAYDRCRDWELTGDHLRLATQQAVAAAKEVYATTRIGEKPVSIVSLAVQKLLASGIRKDERILLIGAGQTNTLVGKFLRKHGFRNVLVFNRSLDKAETLAQLVEGKARPFHALNDYTEGFEALIVCTGATKPILTAPLLERLCGGRPERIRILIDLSIPHNIAPEVIQHHRARYTSIEDLKELAKQNLSFREQEVARAESVLHAQVQDFRQRLEERRLERALRAIPEEIKAVRRKALDEVFSREIETLDAEARQLLEKVVAYMEKKCISIPMKAAKNALLK
ncbi:MAG: glutamyl-tRNA reductase, partial [Bacteroidetes bacterium]